MLTAKELKNISDKMQLPDNVIYGMKDNAIHGLYCYIHPLQLSSANISTLTVLGYRVALCKNETVIDWKQV